MPMTMSDIGVPCRNCKRFINLFLPAISSMPDPFRATCPYCETTAVYEKSSVQNVFGKRGVATNKALLVTVLVAGLILLVGILYVQHQANGAAPPFQAHQGHRP